VKVAKIVQAKWIFRG